MPKKHSLDALEQTLRQASAAREGFLGADERSLATILQADDEAIRRRGLTHAYIAQHLLALRQAGWEGLGEPVSVPPHFEVCVDAARGTLPCPFGDQGSFAKVNTTVHNLASGKEITFTDLNIHLIASHGFYEGHGAQFRLDPEQLMDTLEMGEI
ncbi:MAG: hypothetical protein KJ964_04390 [Verrucomicrobia bacterium]|nr:hypothetical protein [Verrucomicrobiota bacterium]MBU1736091.1 hypothetical protein [Verrucomicrobiota bacterium]MBU1855518.1 hypothetical protein [Verrucomicrobiota bacterium]